MFWKDMWEATVGPLPRSARRRRMQMLDSASVSVMHMYPSAGACFPKRRGPCEGHSCLMVAHRWLHRPPLPTMTTPPFLSPSPSSHFYASAEYFPPLIPSQVSSLTYSSDLYTFNLFHHTHTYTHPPHLIFRIIIPQLRLNSISQRSINSQERQTEGSIC